MTKSRRRAAVAAVVAGLALSACGGGDKASERLVEAMLEQNGDAKVDIGDNGEFTVRTEDGVFASSAQLPEDWPASVALPGDFQAISGSTIGDGAGTMLAATGLTAMSIDEVDQFYANALQGWTEAARYQAGDSLNLTYVSGDETAQINVAEADGETSLTVSYVVVPGSGTDIAANDGEADDDGANEPTSEAEVDAAEAIVGAISGSGSAIDALDQLDLSSKGDAIVIASGADRYEVDGSTIHVYFGDSAEFPVGLECIVATSVLSEGESAVIHRDGNSTPC